MATFHVRARIENEGKSRFEPFPGSFTAIGLTNRVLSA